MLSLFVGELGKLLESSLGLPRGVNESSVLMDGRGELLRLFDKGEMRLHAAFATKRPSEETERVLSNSTVLGLSVRQ